MKPNTSAAENPTASRKVALHAMSRHEEARGRAAAMRRLLGRERNAIWTSVFPLIYQFTRLCRFQISAILRQTVSRWFLKNRNRIRFAPIDARGGFEELQNISALD
jgi:hypothetical protein